jgi:hypothetical protein
MKLYMGNEWCEHVDITVVMMLYIIVIASSTSVVGVYITPVRRLWPNRGESVITSPTQPQ